MFTPIARHPKQFIYCRTHVDRVCVTFTNKIPTTPFWLIEKPRTYNITQKHKHQPGLLTVSMDSRLFLFWKFLIDFSMREHNGLLTKKWMPWIGGYIAWETHPPYCPPMFLNLCKWFQL